MFSAEDVKEVFHLLSSEETLGNPLVISSSGDSFVTRKHLYKAFESYVTVGTQRVSMLTLAQNLDVDVDVLRILVEEYDPSLVLRSANNRDIITKALRDAIQKELEADALNGVISKTAFLSKHDVSQSSLENLLTLSEKHILEVNGCLYSTDYDTETSTTIATLLRDHLQNLQTVNLDSENVPGSPPTWFVRNVLTNLLEDSEFAGKFHVQVQSEGIQCTPVQLVKEKHDSVVANLRSGNIAFLDLQKFQSNNQAMYPTLEEAQAHLESAQDVEVLGAFAISEAWISKFSKDCMQGLLRDDGTDVGTSLRAVFPESLHTAVLDKVEQSMRSLSPGICRAGDYILTELGYSRECSNLLDIARADAASQWNQFKENPKADVKYSLSSLVNQVPPNNPVLQDLIKERTMQRALDDSFSEKILELEKQNEAEFAEFWSDRVATRAAIYTEGLTAIEDQKLQDQLSELLAQYVQKDLVPDAILKGTSQGLILSRKTRKNVQKLESVLGTGNMDISALMSALDRFNKKQSAEAPTPSTLEASKTTMLNDMARRMQKQKKSDGPLLFLTLVVFLFAKHNAGVVYATGKFAPKLLKQLKTVLDAEQYAQLEAWKEAAKAGTLSAEDRDAMKKMVEARV